MSSQPKTWGVVFQRGSWRQSGEEDPFPDIFIEIQCWRQTESCCVFPRSEDRVGYMVFFIASNLVHKLDGGEFAHDFQLRHRIPVQLLIISWESCANYDFLRYVLSISISIVYIYCLYLSNLDFTVVVTCCHLLLKQESKF